MKYLTEWNIITDSDKKSYIIGINSNNHIYTSSYITNIILYIGYIELETETSYFKLYFEDTFTPTVENGRLFKWSIDDLSDIDTDNIMEKDLIGKVLIGHRCCNYSDNLLYTTPIVKIIEYDHSMDIYTESGSKYTVSYDNQY